jgi:hypothetical protein
MLLFWREGRVVFVPLSSVIALLEYRHENGC